MVVVLATNLASSVFADIRNINMSNRSSMPIILNGGEQVSIRCNLPHCNVKTGYAPGHDSAVYVVVSRVPGSSWDTSEISNIYSTKKEAESALDALIKDGTCW